MDQAIRELAIGRIDTMTAAALGSSPNSPVALAAIYQTAMQQATLVCYLDDFKLLGVIFLALPPPLSWVRRGTGGAKSLAVH